MNTSIPFFTLAFLALGSAMMAGLFFVFSNFAMTSFARLRPEAGMAAMQQINTHILNPWFVVLFFGTTLLSIASAIPAAMHLTHPASLWVIIGAAVFILGCFVVTVTANVPLNNILATAEPGLAEGQETWNRYLREWTPWNHVRTVTSTLAAFAYLVALSKLG